MPSPPKPADEYREDQYDVVHFCTWTSRRSFGYSSSNWWATLVCDTNLVTRTVDGPVTCLQCLGHSRGPSALDILEAVHKRNGA